MSRRFIGSSPSHFSYGHTLTLAVAGIIGKTESHRCGMVASHVTDITIVDGIGCIFHPSIRTLAVSYHHRTHSLGCDITLGILVTLLKIEHHDGMVSSSHSRGTTESILFDTVGNIRKGGLVIETQSLRTSRKRNTPVDSLRTILGTGDRFTNISQEKGTSCKYLDIDKSQHLYLFYMSLQFGAIATAVPVAINRIIGLVNAGNMRKNIG